MSSLEIETLEKYLLSENKDEFIKNLIVGSDSYYYFNLLNALNKTLIKDLSQVQDQLIKDYTKLTTNRAKNIRYRYLFKQLDEAKNENDTS